MIETHESTMENPTGIDYDYTHYETPKQKHAHRQWCISMDEFIL